MQSNIFNSNGIKTILNLILNYVHSLVRLNHTGKNFFDSEHTAIQHGWNCLITSLVTIRRQGTPCQINLYYKYYHHGFYLK